MNVLHIPEEKAVRDSSMPHRRTAAEALAILEERERHGVLGVMDEEFAKDVRKFRERHSESLD